MLNYRNLKLSRRIRSFKFRHLFLFLIVLLSFKHSLYAQDQKLADSLKLIFDNQEERLLDTAKLYYLFEIGFHENNQKKRLTYVNKLLQLAKKLSAELWLYKGHYLKGNILRLQGNLDDAMNNYLISLTLANKLDHKSGIGESNMALGDIYSIEGNHLTSLNYYNKSISILRKTRDSTTLAMALLNAGDEYFNANKLDSAILYFKESGKIFQDQDYLIGTAYNLGNVGMVYAKRDQPDKAERNMQRAIEILTDLGDYYPIAVYDTYISDIYLEKGDFKRALQYAQHSLDISLEHGLKEQIRDASLKLSELYELQKNYRQAFEYQKQYLVYRDSINNEETIRKMADLRTEYEVSQKQTEIDLLESKQQIQNIMFGSMAAVIILLAFLAFMYYRNNKRKQMLNTIIMERKEEVEAQRDQLEAMNETREKFLSIIAHDLLGPVNSFKGFSTIMRFSIDQNDTDTLNEIHHQFDQSVNGLSNLLTDLLDWSVTQQGDIPYKPEKIDLKDISDELLDLFHNMAETKKIELSSSIAQSQFVHADRNSVKTILRNLVSNAIKFTKEDGLINLSTIICDDFVKVSVIDTGIGMSKEKQDKLLHNTDYNRSWGTKGEKGLGLGLQLVKEFTKVNHGEMSIESEENVGTTITISLPTYHSSSKLN